MNPYTEEILLAYSLPRETLTAVMILYKNTKAMVCLLDGDTDFFDIIIEDVLQEDTLAQYFLCTLNFDRSNK